jgi:hypothetical protein
MLTNASWDDLQHALLEINNTRYDRNIRFKKWRDEGTREKRIRFTLTVVSSRGPGARRSGTGRRIAAACWHAHGHFFEALFRINPLAWVKVDRQGKIKITEDYGNWQDCTIGSRAMPMMFSEACECTE